MKTSNSLLHTDGQSEQRKVCVRKRGCMAAIIILLAVPTSTINADGVIGDKVLESLGAGLYETASGALCYSARAQTIGQPILDALVLRDARGSDLNAATFARTLTLMQQGGGAPSSRTSGNTLQVAIPNYTLPRGASTPTFASLSLYSFNVEQGSPNRGRMLSAPQTLAPERQLSALLSAETDFNADFNRDGVIGDSVLRDLGGGLYASGAGALYYSPVPQTIGSAITQAATLLRDARGNALGAAAFAPKSELIQVASSSTGSIQENGVLTLAVPNYTAVSRLNGMNPTNQPALPRFNHSQVWTGEKLIVWGGSYWTDNTQTTTRVYDDGGIYDPATDTWELINSTDPETPTPRAGHTAVWTGGKMIVWGGSGAKTRDSNGGLAWDEYNDGGIYDPATDTWEPVAMDPDIPTSRAGHTAVWTGNRMIVWGGVFEGNGATYNLVDDEDPWSPLDTLNAPQARVGHGAVVAGGRMAIWGGSVESTSYENSVWQGSGAFYDYASGEWESISTLNAPWGGEGWWAEDGERGVEILWTGSKLLVLPINSFRNGRWVHSGGIYNPSTSTWEPIATTGAPNARPYMAAITRDGSLFAAGSSGNNFAGLVYNFGTRRWSQAMRGVTGSFQGRRGSWAPELGEMLVFGGMWANTPSPFSGRAAGKRGFRLQVNKPVFSSLKVSRFNMVSGRLVSTTKLNSRQAQQVRDAEIKFGIDFDGNSILGSVP